MENRERMLKIVEEAQAEWRALLDLYLNEAINDIPSQAEYITDKLLKNGACFKLIITKKAESVSKSLIL